MQQFITEITQCCTVIIFSREKEEDLFAHQAEEFEVEVFPVEFFVLPVGEILEEEVLSQKIKQKKDLQQPQKLAFLLLAN